MDPCIHGEEPLNQKNADGRTAFQLYIVDFELRNIYKRNPSPIRIPIFSSEVASSFIDSGADLVLSIWFVLAIVEQRKLIYSCGANSLGVVWCSL